MIQFSNSLTKQKEKFVPLNKKRVGLYTCGPTVYDFAHIGNLRSYILADILQRTLKFNGLNVLWVMNITDVDDKTIRRSKDLTSDKNPKELLGEYTQKYENFFWADLKKINVNSPDKTPTATETIRQMQELIENIFNSGYAYQKDGSVYFDVKKYAQNFKYGQLVKIDLRDLKAGTRIDADEYDKENIQDFVLWKAAKEGEPSWDFELDNKKLPGRPGWHIECSAMSEKYLGVPFDIHTGGIDLKFPHHENEIAQSVVGYNKEKLANFFLHNGHVLVEGKKMAKRFQNFFTLQDLEKRGFKPLAYRYLVLQSHYKSPLNFTWLSLEAAQNGLEKIYEQIKKILAEKKDVKSAEFQINLQKFQTLINNDLDTPAALAFTHEILNQKTLKPGIKRALIFKFDKILGLGFSDLEEVKIPKKILNLAKEREAARRDKNWEKSDSLRSEIEKHGYIIEDTKRDFVIKKKQ